MQRRDFLKVATGLGAAVVVPFHVNAQDEPAATPGASPAAIATSGYAPVNGVDLYHEVLGAEAPGVPLVMLHGGFMTSDLAFGQVAPILSQTRPVIVVDLRGHGRTADVAGPIRFEDLADDVAALLAYLGIEQVDVVGYSLGGGTGWQLAIRHPEVVRKLVAASAPIRGDGWDAVARAAFEYVNEDAAAAMVGTPLEQAYVAVAPRPEDWPVLVTKVGDLLRTDYDWTAAVGALTQPTMVVVGDADSVRPEHAIEAFRLRGGGVPGDFAPLPPAQCLIIPHTAHSFVLSRTEWLLEDLPVFLDEPVA